MYNNNSNSFSLASYGYTFIMTELRPLIERYISRYTDNLCVFDVKLIDRSNNVATFLVLTSALTLWTFKYGFSHPERWKDHELQSSSKLLDAHEHTALRNCYLKIYGMNEFKASKACIDFFINSPTCLEKEYR